MNDIYNNKIETTIDRYLQSSFSLWNAILTINGIMLAAFSLIKANSDLEIKLILTATILCVISIIGVVYNFFTAKSTYYRIGEVLNNPDELTEKQKAKDINKSLLRNKLMTYSERGCLTFLIIEALVVFALIGLRFLN